jgi:hypothetical protein
MKIKSFIATACLLGISSTYAQSANSLTGQWTGITKSPANGVELQIQVLITESKGVWKFSAPAATRRPNPCFDREFPLTIQAGVGEKYVFNIDGPSVIQGCPSFFVNLQKTDEQTLSGNFGDGRLAVLKKK